MMRKEKRLWTVLALITALLTCSSITRSQTLSGSALVAALKQGGYVIVIRHASSPRDTPDGSKANPDNTTLERQLDEAGRATSAAMGKAMHDLKIPVGEVLSSPTYRALETVRLAGWPNPKTAPELGDGGQSMQGVSEAQGLWLQKRVTQASPGTNTILVTHMPNITRTFPDITGVADGEALIFHPDGKSNPPLLLA